MSRQVSSAELDYACKYVGIRRDKVSRDTIHTLTALMLEPAIESRAFLVVVSDRELHELGPDDAHLFTEAQQNKPILGASFAAVAAAALITPETVSHFHGSDVIPALVHVLSYGLPFGQYYAIVALHELLTVSPRASKEDLARQYLNRGILGGLLDCCDSLSSNWQLDAGSALIKAVFDVLTGEACIFADSCDPLVASLVSESTALAVLSFLTRRLHDTAWLTGIPSLDQTASGSNNFAIVSRALLAVLRLPVFRTCIEKARTLFTVASILSASEASDIGISSLHTLLILEITLLCMTPITSELSLKSQAVLDSVDISSLLVFDFFGAIARLLVPSDLALTRQVLMCFTLISRNSLFRVNCINSLAPGQNTLTLLTITQQVLASDECCKDLEVIQLLLSMLAGFCTNKQFRAFLYSDSETIGQIAKVVADVLEQARVLPTELAASMLKSSTASVLKLTSHDHLGKTATSLVQALEQSRDIMTISQGTLGLTDTVSVVTAGLRASRVAQALGASTSSLSSSMGGSSVSAIYSQVTRAPALADLGINPFHDHFRVFAAISELLSIVCVDYGTLIDFRQVNFYNPRDSMNAALQDHAHVLLDTFLPLLLSIGEFLRRFVAESIDFLMDPIVETVLGATYELSQLDIALIPFLSGQTDLALLRNKFRICTGKRVPVLTELEVKVLRLLVLFSRNPRVVSLAAFACALMRKNGVCLSVLDTVETVTNVKWAIDQLRQHVSRICASGDVDFFKRASAGPVCDITAELASLLAGMAVDDPTLVPVDTAVSLLQLWRTLSKANPEEMEFVFGSVSQLLKAWPEAKRGMLRGKMHDKGLEILANSVWKPDA
ncbi:hypothetical protein GMRT_16097 [Giardia muris]|uniref:Uncharacterized protein n=1 Tax=Giardia muris TaxID=5742 RepID=A0A4Z1SQ03_GIAMU|nr:hypothetical protein GMRT_16097 [Giardia muris]|eukprot:TNJ27912.1 hypothetical protein GMRT_16097 [Giardia muris]